MNEVRLGLIGCGGIAQVHLGYLKETPRLRLTAASDNFAPNLEKVVKAHNVQGFDDGVKLLDSGLVDAVLIATPHYFHPDYSRAALQRNLHVLTEKPVAVTAAAAAAVDELAATKPQLRYAAMFQQRTFPRYQRARQIIQSGELGELRRVHWTITNWFRTQAYYNSGSWRATWKGEGGGVLLNQCPHNLDMLCWLLGSPASVEAKISLGRYHKIEVEDDVTAFLTYPNGATGLFVTSTGEAPGSDYFEIVGNRGKLVLSGSSLELHQTSEPVSEFCANSPEVWGSPRTTKISYECPQGGLHKLITINFVESILDGKPLLAPASQGIHSVELANAMIQSGLTGRRINLPMDRPAYEKFLADLIAKSGR